MTQLQAQFNKKSLLGGNFGIEREGLRCDVHGRLVQTPHPSVFGDKLDNPYITTDFSESQIEVITPTFKTIDATYQFLEALYDMTVSEIGDEYLWPQSMPCIIPDDDQIPIATYGDSDEQAYHYRKKLMAKYGGKRQLLSGIHYNFSFDEQLIQQCYEQAGGDKSYRDFRDQVYLKVARNYLRYRWLLIYLLGSTSVMHTSYNTAYTDALEPLHQESYTNEGAVSYRNSHYGYTNKEVLYPDYTSVSGYQESIKQFIQDGVIDGPKELYSQVRLKAYDHTDFMTSLTEKGIAYLEYRSIDINPFDKAGIKKQDLYFMQLFNLYMLFAEEGTYTAWQQEAQYNQEQIAQFGQKNVMLLKDGEAVTREAWGIELIDAMTHLNTTFGLDQEDVLARMREKIMDAKHTYAYQIRQKVAEEGYVGAHMTLAKAYKEAAYRQRYKLPGYEDLELSTQLVLKEAIKRGIRFEIMDRSEHFIRLQKHGNVQYVKQATKTSQDTYVSVLMMANKTVTKEVLKRAGIVVPEGTHFDTLADAYEGLKAYTHQPVVIKPKSTNFGLGISIFPEGADEEDLKQAVTIAFTHDQTVLIESFIPGKEYRFLVMQDKVVGILHRVPANVIGDGVHTISELVAVKNKDPLRGKGYKTPLEKIVLDESAALFLKQTGATFETVPVRGEVVYLRENSNISTGGDSMDYTDKIPQYYKEIAVAAARTVDAKICGVDMMLSDYTDETAPYGIIELNFNPAIHIHCYPYEGTERNIAAAVLGVLGYHV